MKAIDTIVELTPEQAEAAMRDALAEQGFGVLTEIDVAATLKAKLGVDRPPLKILGACNPTIAHRALELDPSVSLLLPCNVVIEVVDGRTRVAAVDPRRTDGRPPLRRPGRRRRDPPARRHRPRRRLTGSAQDRSDVATPSSRIAAPPPTVDRYSARRAAASPPTDVELAGSAVIPVARPPVALGRRRAGRAVRGRRGAPVSQPRRGRVHQRPARRGRPGAGVPALVFERASRRRLQVPAGDRRLRGRPAPPPSAFAGRAADGGDVAIICRNTTEAINHLAYRLRFQPDDVVVTTVVEHHANLLPWARLCQRRFVECGPDGTFDTDAVTAALDAVAPRRGCWPSPGRRT